MEKRRYLPDTWSERSLKGTVENGACPYFIIETRISSNYN